MTAHLTRFYKTADAYPADDGFQIRLDEKPIKTPDGQLLLLPNQNAAHLIADEWNRQGDKIGPEDLRLTRLANVALDRMDQARAETIEHLGLHLQTDLVCMRAAHPQSLVLAQAEAWDPILHYLHKEWSIKLLISNNLLPPLLDKHSMETFNGVTGDLDIFRLSALAHASALLGSTALGWTLLHGHIDAAQAMELSIVEERHQRRMWGEDAAALQREALIRDELIELSAFIAAL